MTRERPTMLQVCAVDFTAFHLLRPLFAAARADGWNVRFACAAGPWSPILRAEGFEHWAIPIVRTPSPAAHARAAVALAVRLRREPPDLVHTHTPIGGMVGRAAAILGGDMPVAHTFHGLPFRADSLSGRERAFVWIERLLARRTDRFFSQAAGDAERAVALGVARADRLTVIGNGVDLDRFRPDAEERRRVREELGIGEDDAVVMTVGRVVREKGILELADAALCIHTEKPLHVLVVGTSLASDRSSVEAELDAHPVTRSSVRWRRLGQRDDVDRLLRAADVFVLASHREGLPRSVIEALATGVPVVATDIPACRELVDDEVGVLVPVGDAPAIAAAIEGLLGDPARRRDMSRRARERAAARHDERRIVATQLRVLRTLVP